MGNEQERIEADTTAKDSSEMVQTEVIVQLYVVLGQIEILKQAVINMAQEIEIKQKGE